MNKELKILHLIDSLAFGGAQSVVKGIFESSLVDSRFFLFAMRKRETLVKINHPNIQIFASAKKYSLRPLLALRDLIKEEEISILHCHLFRANIFGLILKIIWFPKIKLIIHEHGGIIENGLLYRLSLFIFQKKVDVFIAVSQWIRESLITRAKIRGQKIEVIYNFVDLSRFVTNASREMINLQKRRLGFSDSDFVIGFAGRLIDRKGWREFVNFAEYFLHNNKEVKFIIAGDGPQRTELIDFINKKNIGHSLIYQGYVEDMVSFYSLLGCLIIPSSWEGSPMVQLEAAAMNVPIISSWAPGCNEIFVNNKSGLYFNRSDLSELAKKVNLLIKNANFCEDIIKNARESIIKFNLDNYMLKLVSLYSDLG